MDTSRIEELLRLMEEHGLAELEVESEDFRVKLRKHESPREGPPAPHPAAAAGASPEVAAAAGKSAPAAPAEGKPEVIKSPMVGTFYRASAPDAAPFAQVGDHVDDETIVCIVEAMKVMNEVRAEVVGTISKVLVENGAPVEFGTPLFEVVA
jgi:acetyl-CoA carboxylase biotin carboxyl carrier protein